MKIVHQRIALAVVFTLILAGSGLGTVHAQQITGSIWWVDGQVTASENVNEISPGSGYVSDLPGSSFTFTANPGEGLRFFRWMRWSGSGNPYATSNYIELNKYGDDNPLIWTYDAVSGQSVTLALVTTWIKYKLTYEGGATTEQLFTNRITIADCMTKRTGYTFSGSWTNASGKAFKSGDDLDGFAFDINNHDDSAIVTLYPKWTVNRCTIAYVLGGGTHGASHPEAAEYDREFVVSDPVRTGYGLKEWAISPEPSESGSRIVRENGETRFMNIFTEGGTKITLTAVWTNCSYRVDFNNHGAESGPDPMTVQFDQPYRSVNVPKKTGNTFLGYYTAVTGGDLLWDREGQPMREKWDIAADQEVHAHWEAETFYVTYEANGGVGEISSQLITNGVPTTLSKGSGLSLSGCMLIGWARDAKAATPEFALGATQTFTSATVLYAVWQASYFVAFDGHGATFGEMPVTMFVRGEEKPLPANVFEKTGYTFGGWAESAAKADVLVKKYDDRQLVKDICNVPGATNTLFAVWNTNTYYVAFDKGIGSGEPMEVMTFVYDQTQRLSKCTYAPPQELYAFAGWQDGFTGELIPDEAVVSNLCTTANATNVLKATWVLDVGDWSKHMHCTTLRWGMNDRGSATPKWEMMDGPQWGCTNTGSCVRQESGGSGTAAMAWLEAVVKTNGTLTFAYKLATNRSSFERNPWFCVGFSNGTSEFNADSVYDVSYQDIFVGNEWQSLTVPIVLASETSEVFIHIAYDFGEPDEYLCIDQVKWMPEGGDEPPVPGPDDAVGISSATVEGNAFKLSFTSDERFDYNLLTNANLLIDGWGVWGKKQGDGKVLLFEPTIQPGVPQMFYKVETIRKK